MSVFSKGVCAASLLAAAAGAAAADDENHPLLNDKFRASLGVFYAESNTTARLGTPGGGAAIDVNFEDTLGLEKSRPVTELTMYWRITDRWRLDVDYFSIPRNASRTLSRDITWGGNTYTAGTVVDSSFRISDLRAAVGYSFFRRPDKELGVGVGLHTTTFKASLDAAGIGAESGSATAPLPVLALYGNFALTNRWALTLRTDWLSLDYDKYAGSIRSSAIDVIYQPWKNWAVGFGVHSLNMSVEVDDAKGKFATRMALQGPAAYVSYSF
jgi:hypothetical protein